MNKFKPGDEVKIVSLNNTHREFGKVNGLLPKGSLNTIDYVGGCRCNFVGNEFTYHVDDLKLVKDKGEIGTKLYNPLVAQEGGGHYKNRGIQPIEYSEANNLGACQHSVVKYITRHQDKNGIEDLSKIIHFTFLEAYFKYGEQGSTELKEKVLKLLGEHE